MTYLQILNIIKETALAQPNVNSVVREFTDLNREDARYSAVVIQDRDGERDRIYEQDWNTYTWHLGYVDRLTYDESNRDDIYSTGINIINNIVSSIRDAWFPDLDVNLIDRFTTFNQRFTASCAGVYVVLAVQVPVSDCVDGAEGVSFDSLKVDISENGHYRYVPDGRPYGEVLIDVDVYEDCKEELNLVETVTSNGSYQYTPESGQVYGAVSIAVDVHPQDSLDETYITNGRKTIAGEFNGGIVNVNVHPSESLVKTYTSNKTYHINGEWRNAEILVDVHPSDSLVETITSNGTVSYSGEWRDASITVSVPASYKPETICDEIIQENGSFHYYPAQGEVFNDVHITTDIHPSERLVRNYTTNGQKTVSGEWTDATINISVHPSASLSETYISNGSYSISGEFNGGVVTVQVPDGSLPAPADDEIYYITYTGRPLQNIYFNDFDVNIVSNTYDSARNICVLKFDGTLTRIGDNAFEYKPQLKKMRLPDTVTSVGVRSFWQSGLTEIRMDGVRTIEDSAFGDCYALLSNMCIPAGCTRIEARAYMHSSGAHTVVIPSSVTYIGESAFSDDFPLQEVYVNASVPPVLGYSQQYGYDQFANTSGNMTIIVPAAALNDYLTAPGWSDYASVIVAQQ